MRTHKEPEVNIAAYAQAVSRATFPRTVKPDSMQLSAAQAVAPEAEVPVMDDGWCPEIVYPLPNVRTHTEPEIDIASSAHAVSRASFLKRSDP